MGTQNVKSGRDSQQLRSFMKQLLNDVRALETMLEEGLIESDTMRIGVEQEVFLVDNSWYPAPKSTQVLDQTEDPHFTTELGLFNLEMNMDPLVFQGRCLTELEAQLNRYLNALDLLTKEQGIQYLLVGILPTIRKSDLTLDNMTPKSRYRALDQALKRLRSGMPYNFYIKGVDELNIQHNSVMVEACNTSFQVHFQVKPEEFVQRYNIAQAVAAPVLAASTNSPLLFGKRLWYETRIALFQQAVDTRSETPHQRELQPRVTFGNQWVKNSVLEIFQEDIARFRVLLGTEKTEDPFQKIKAGTPPSLHALQLHNGTVYRWNRACYGIADGKAHLRIENRILPSGPSVVDEVANAAFWFGLMNGMAAEFDDISTVMDFDDVKSNFLSASRRGLEAQFTWTEHKVYPAQQLICDELIPLAKKGLQSAGIIPEDIERFLGIIDERVKKNQTGTQWILNSFAGMKDHGTLTEKLTSITAAVAHRQREGRPVHEWPLAQIEESGGWKQSYMLVEQYMDTDLYTVNQDELIDLVANLMVWKNTRHVLVEDTRHRLVGIVSHRTLLRLIGEDSLTKKRKQPSSVKAIMYKDPITISPETTTLEAIKLMRQEGISALPVTKDEHLVGLVTEKHFMTIARQLLEQKLKE